MKSALLPVALFAVGLPQPTPAAPPITKTEIRTDPPDRTHRRLRDQMWDMFEMRDLRRPQAPKRELGDVWLRTKPRSTEVKGLCRFDGVTLEFAPIGRRDQGADTPVRAVGLEATHFFHFLDPPTDTYDELSDHRRLPTEGGCSAIDIDKTDFFTADSEENATEGYRAFLELQRALRQAQSAVKLECDLYPVDTLGCQDLILSFGQNHLSSIATCEAPSGKDCFEVDADGDRRIRIVVDQGKVTEAQLHSMIVMWHEHVD